MEFTGTETFDLDEAPAHALVAREVIEAAEPDAVELGGEAAAEAGHMGPRAQAESCRLGACAEGPGGADRALGVFGDSGLRQFGQEPKRPVEGIRRRLSAFGGVLAVAGQVAAASAREGPGVPMRDQFPEVSPA